MNLDLLYVLPLILQADIGAKLIHLVFAFGTAWLIWAHVTKQLGTNWGIFAAIFFLSMPIIVRTATSAYVDLGVAFFSTASILLILRWSDSHKLSFLIMAAVCAGLAAGTKYNGLIVIFLLTCFIPFLDKSNDNSHYSTRLLGLCIVFFLLAILVASPWLIRNFIWVENPVYPLFQSFFSETAAATEIGLQPLLIRKLVYDEPLWYTLLIPFRIFFQGKDDNPQFFDGILNPFILIFIFLLFIPFLKETRLRKQIKYFLMVCNPIYDFYSTAKSSQSSLSDPGFADFDNTLDIRIVSFI